MFRVSLANAFAKRSLRPLHEKHQATPVNVLLDSTVTEVYSGQVAELNTDGTVKLFDGTGTPWGLFALDRNTVINDADGQPTDLGSGANGIPFAIWQGGPDAYFRITDDTGSSEKILDNDVTWAVGNKLHAIAAGQLTNTGGVIIGDVVEVLAQNDIVIRLTVPNVAPA